MQLRDYQQKAHDAIFNEWEKKGTQRTLLVLPTGCGKTIVFAKVAEDCVKKGDKVLILAHRGELLEQASDKIKKVTGLRCAVEKAEQTCIGKWFRIVTGSVQTLQNDKRLSKFSKDYFDTIIIDEAHHVLSNGYQKVLEYFNSAKVLGVTATPDRGDMKNLGSYFQTLAYEYTLPEAIKSGYLVPIKALTIPLTLDLSSVSMSAGDFKASDIGSALDPYLEGIASEMEKYCKNRKTVVFLPLISTSQKFVEILNKHGFKATEVNGNSKDRNEITKDFAENKYNVLCNSMLLTEGWDCPDVDCVIVLRPTKVRSLYSQMVGRGTRLSPQTGKKDLLLLDFLWHSERHELCHPASLICNSDEVAKKMTKKLEDSAGVEMDIQEAEEEALKDVQEEREKALAEQLAEMRKRKKKLVDPLQYAMSIQAEDLQNYIPSFGWECAPANEKQLKYLESHGIESNEVPNAGYASMLIDRLKLRSKEGLATPKQVRFLERRGFRNVGTWKFKDANSMISRISANSWRIPKGVQASTYKPEGVE